MQKTFAVVTFAAVLFAVSAPAFAGPGCNKTTHTTTASATIVLPPADQTASTPQQTPVPGN